MKKNLLLLLFLSFIFLFSSCLTSPMTLQNMKISSFEIKTKDSLAYPGKQVLVWAEVINKKGTRFTNVHNGGSLYADKEFCWRVGDTTAPFVRFRKDKPMLLAIPHGYNPDAKNDSITLCVRSKSTDMEAFLRLPLSYNTNAVLDFSGKDGKLGGLKDRDGEHGEHAYNVLVVVEKHPEENNGLYLVSGTASDGTKKYAAFTPGHTLTVKANGGEGGMGFIGSYGYSGSTGSYTTVKDNEGGSKRVYTGAGGDGSDGGMGGNGGDGGNGGHIEFQLNGAPRSIFLYECKGGKGGDGGSGGMGGSGGSGAPRGKSGSNGQNGFRGRNGEHGKVSYLD